MEGYRLRDHWTGGGGLWRAIMTQGLFEILAYISSRYVVLN